MRIISDYEFHRSVQVLCSLLGDRDTKHIKRVVGIAHVAALHAVHSGFVLAVEQVYENRFFALAEPIPEFIGDYGVGPSVGVFLLDEGFFGDFVYVFVHGA